MSRIALSDREREFIVRGIAEGIRADGRSCSDYRHFQLCTDAVSNTSGSAEIQLDQTSIAVGVKAEIGVPDPITPNRGRVEFFVDCSALASPQFEGRSGEELGQHLAYCLGELYSSRDCLDLEALIIIPGQQCWVLFVDALVLEWSGGVLDCLSMAVWAALVSTRIPKLVVTGERDDLEIEVSDNPYDVSTLDVSRAPVFVSLSLVDKQFLVDASQEEEACANCRLTVAINRAGQLCGVMKEGKGTLSWEQYSKAVKLSSEVAKSRLSKLDTSIRAGTATTRD